LIIYDRTTRCVNEKVETWANRKGRAVMALPSSHIRLLEADV